MKSSRLAHIFSFILMVNIVSSEFSADDCKSLGFNKANLLCSTCEEFNKHGLTEILSNCKECCLKDDDYDASGLKKYPRAVLEVCTCKFGTYPQIQAFIKSDRPSKYKNLQIKYVRGLDPIIKLLDADNKVEDILDIHKWDTDSVDEFLATHLSMD
ncbi:selenoprotein F [Bombus vosnesenskii]|uniref:Selenoprotein F n=4 Tax=Bombus TaxID=28641 RepID=A0A6J3K7M7_9HYME|nr:selenoprotein F [Bombus terrestris]XP_003487759.1 selenoprotein F [Bombus impatiens]XP_033183688.1 selenoprotein F [Bombus vancouverensis nearcticus]XP_033297862.1 selenoprotein F [Bombus bifarius]XP_033349097.1 selenoprotein F [Bombus vosnesenskii]XP_050470160.1 selenoprotein F [Bombus huntii]